MPKTILVVDDEQDTLRVLQISLQQGGFEVQTAQDGRQALDMVAVAAPDLILMDHMMPVMDGFEALRELKSNPATAKIPVVMLTANDSYAEMAKGWEIGSDLHLTKPVPVTELLDLVQCILA